MYKPHWTGSEDEKLRVLISQGVSYKDIAGKLDRSWDACRLRGRRIGISIQPAKIWKTTECAALERYKKEGLTNQRIAVILGRSIKSIEAQVYKMQICRERISDEDKKQVIRMYYKGASHKEITKTLNLGINASKNIIARLSSRDKWRYKQARKANKGVNHV